MCIRHEGMRCTGVCEGDSPSFLWLVSANRGLNDPDDPTQESWGGQFQRDGNTNHYVDGPGPSSISKWRSDYQAEFQERADWCISRPYHTKTFIGLEVRWIGTQGAYTRFYTLTLRPNAPCSY